MKNLDDVAGIRIICSFVDDIYEVAEMLVRQDDVTVIAIKDYIKNPKPNGYRSYHMIIEIPVFFSDSKKPIRVEVQIRTIAMDFWASLDHQLKYKKSFVDLNGEISGELKQCADVIAQTDNKMLEIRKRIEAPEECDCYFKGLILIKRQGLRNAKPCLFYTGPWPGDFLRKPEALWS